MTNNFCRSVNMPIDSSVVSQIQSLFAASPEKNTTSNFSFSQFVAMIFLIACHANSTRPNIIYMHRNWRAIAMFASYVTLSGKDVQNMNFLPCSSLCGNEGKHAQYLKQSKLMPTICFQNFLQNWVYIYLSRENILLDCESMECKNLFTISAKISHVQK